MESFPQTLSFSKSSVLMGTFGGGVSMERTCPHFGGIPVLQKSWFSGNEVPNHHDFPLLSLKHDHARSSWRTGDKAPRRRRMMIDIPSEKELHIL